MQRLERCIAERQAFALIHITGPVEEMLDQRRKILHPFTERREGEGNHGKAKVQVFAERAVMNRLFQIFIRGGEKTHVGPYFLCSADTVECPILQDSQEMALHGEGHVADLVKKQRASLGDLDFARLPLDGAGERALLVAKELILQ